MRHLIQIFEKRREDLVVLLEDKSLDAGRQHQVYGAIQEITLVLQALESCQGGSL